MASGASRSCLGWSFSADGAALAATAVGVGAAANYWAAMEDETAGDIKVLAKGKGDYKADVDQPTEGEEGAERWR
jgi:hypothetical protein